MGEVTDLVHITEIWVGELEGPDLSLCCLSGYLVQYHARLEQQGRDVVVAALNFIIRASPSGSWM